MTLTKRVLLGLGILLLFWLLAHIGIDFWIKNKLPELLDEKNKSPYHITYNRIDVSLLTLTIDAHNVVVAPKAALKDSTQKSGIYAKIGSVKVSSFRVWALLFSDRISAKKIHIDNPELILIKSDSTKTANVRGIKNQVVEPFKNVIDVADVDLTRGSVIIKDSRERIELSAKNIRIQLEGIGIDETILEHKIPFEFKSYALEASNLFYRPKGIYEITAASVNTTHNGLSAAGFKMRPLVSRERYSRMLSTERDLFTINAKEIRLDRLRWGFGPNQDLFVHADRVLLDAVRANIYRDKTVEDDMRKKKLYSQLLRELSFDLKIDTLRLANGHIEYEEKINERGPGKLSFGNFNLYAQNITSKFGRETTPEVQIHIRSRFMNRAPLRVDWGFNPSDNTDGFTMKGHIENLGADDLTNFVKPYMNISATGTLARVEFDLKGNDLGAGGQFGMLYDDVKVTVYRKKKPEKKNKIVSAVANLLVKSDSDDQQKSTEVAVAREQHKSFYNLFWKCLEDGLKKILL